MRRGADDVLEFQPPVFVSVAVIFGVAIVDGSMLVMLMVVVVAVEGWNAAAAEMSKATTRANIPDFAVLEALLVDGTLVL